MLKDRQRRYTEVTLHGKVVARDYPTARGLLVRALMFSGKTWDVPHYMMVTGAEICRVCECTDTSMSNCRSVGQHVPTVAEPLPRAFAHFRKKRLISAS